MSNVRFRTFFGVIQNLHWPVFVAVPGGPVIQLALSTAAELQQLIPVLFHKEQYTGEAYHHEVWQTGKDPRSLYGRANTEPACQRHGDLVGAYHCPGRAVWIEAG